MSEDELPPLSSDPALSGFWEHLLGFCVRHKVIVGAVTLALVVAGLVVSPFGSGLGALPSAPLAVDAIPDLGENQQIVYADWPGRSPRDIENQITYPLTSALLGLAGVRTIRSTSMLGFASVYVIFEEDVEFYWARSRILEKLASLPAGTLPDGVTAKLGPDATALGQVFWYTLEGRDRDGKTVGGWDQHELRSLQDWTVRFALQSVPGVAEVASIGGHVLEYQVDVDAHAMRARGVTLQEIADAVRGSSLDVGARTIEVNGIDYVVRGVGALASVAELEEAVVATRGFTPIRVRDVARVTRGPAARSGALDVSGAPAVGGVVVVRFGENPLEVIERVEAKVRELAPSLPRRVLDDGTVSQVALVPFYDRTGLIHETLGTLSEALVQQTLLTILVVLWLLRHLTSSLIIATILPLGVLASFVAMKLAGVGANVMSLSGIAIAIGEMIDMGIVLTENVVMRLRQAPREADRRLVVTRAAAEVAPAVVVSVLTTVISFVPVFALTESEGKLFSPLAFTKTTALGASLLVALLLIPPLAHLLVRRATSPRWARLGNAAAILVAVSFLAWVWRPMQAHQSWFASLVFVAVLLVVVLGGFSLWARGYPSMLRVLLEHKAAFLALPAFILGFGLVTWLGFGRLFGWLPDVVRLSRPVVAIAHALPGFGREFMPPFDEGSFMVMPSTTPQVSLGGALEQLAAMDAAIQRIPEVETVVGKLGRVESALDPAPISMFETLVTYKSEYRTEADGTRVRQWRAHIRNTDDLWAEIAAAAELPGVTSAPKLMPIATRIVMLQSGLRAPMGLKVRGPTLEAIERAGVALEGALRRVPSIRPETVFADRLVGKPYLEIAFDRTAIARYGLTMAAVQEVLQLGVGGEPLTRTIEGRERYAVRVRYMRDERDLEAMARLSVPTPRAGVTVPLGELAQLRFVRGPEMIRAEDTFLTGYVLFDRRAETAEVDVVRQAEEALLSEVASGKLMLPDGVTYGFAGTYENELRSSRALAFIVPLVFLIIFLTIYLHFRNVVVSLLTFSGATVAMAGGFIALWVFGLPGVSEVEVLGNELGDLFHVGPMNLSVAVWVGFLALIGVATDDGIVMATYIGQELERRRPETPAAIREAVLFAGTRRIGACLMTIATTILALVPVFTSPGRGSDIMVPMALPSMGGIVIESISVFIVPVLYCAYEEAKLKRRRAHERLPGERAHLPETS